MHRNAAVRLSIASSVAAVLLGLGYASEQARYIAPPREANIECVADAPTVGNAIVVSRASNTTANELKNTLDEATDDDAGKIRKATVEWVKAKYPDAKIEGVFMLAFAKGNLYLAGADTQFGGDKRATVDVLVRRYTRKSGGQYFRAEGLEPERAAQMRQKADFDADATETATAPNNANATGWDDADECMR